MMITDACVFPLPTGDSTVRRMALEAGELGYDSIVAAGTPPAEYQGITVLPGLLIREPEIAGVISRLNKSRGMQALVSVEAGSNAFNRAVLGMRGVHVLRGIHGSEKGAFDYVTAKMAAEHSIALDIDLSMFIQNRGKVRQRVLNSYTELIRLYRHFDFPLVISSHAVSILGMRTVREVSGLASLVGLDTEDVRRALGNVEQALSLFRGPVRVIG